MSHIVIRHVGTIKDSAAVVFIGDERATDLSEDFSSVVFFFVDRFEDEWMVAL